MGPETKPVRPDCIVFVFPAEKRDGKSDDDHDLIRMGTRPYARKQGKPTVDDGPTNRQTDITTKRRVEFYIFTMTTRRTAVYVQSHLITRSRLQKY